MESKNIDLKGIQTLLAITVSIITICGVFFGIRQQVNVNTMAITEMKQQMTKQNEVLDGLVKQVIILNEKAGIPNR